jgi:hypothetical protein
MAPVPESCHRLTSAPSSECPNSGARKETLPSYSRSRSALGWKAVIRSPRPWLVEVCQKSAIGYVRHDDRRSLTPLSRTQSDLSAGSGDRGCSRSELFSRNKFGCCES